MTHLVLFGFGGAVVVLVLLSVFVHWGRIGKEHWVVFFILGMIIAESVLYPNENTITRGLFHPGTGTLQFRLPEVLISVALIARLIVRGAPRTIGRPALLWAALAGWFVLEAVEGHLRHNDFTTLTFEAKLIIYIMGGYALAAGTSVRTVVGGRSFVYLVRITGLAAAVLIFMTLDGRVIAVNLPLIPLYNLGQVGTDAATVFVAIGIIGLLLELARPQRSGWTLLAVVPLMLSPFFAYQRAVLLTLGATVVVVVVVAMGTTARRRLRVRVGEVAMTALAVAGVALVVALVPAAAGQTSVNAPFASTIAQTLGPTLTGEAKAESAQDRINKWQVAWDAAKEHPFLGQGLGFEYQYFAVGPNQVVTTGITENLELDLFLTAGIVGVLLFFLALGTSVVQGFMAWRLHPDRTVAVAALALVAIVVGFVAKGQVESIFENYRLATEWGLFLGLLRSAVTSGGGSLRALRTFDPEHQHEVV